ncbi:RNA 2'-phosphotransferase [Fuerstiella marisgermanici]|uniref:RNA 2'-phosphotransferase n=1 Tax=Fuerstiella marisgermanici TaxID=1891926 RepID=UPI001314E1A7|nr:RNA 2'-phosphotransferase [Fuerstiella marisgermanici]
MHRVYRFVIRLLRHGAGFKSLSIDPDGWVAIEDLLQRINRRALEFELWRDWTIHDLQRQCELHGGRRLQISDDQELVRARYGHTIPDICAGKRRTPPHVLYHGTSQKLAGQILQHGLQRRERNLVHLTSCFDYAAWIARNHGSPAVLQVITDHAASAGIPFWQCNDHVWQSTDLPASAIQPIRGKALTQQKKDLP